MDRIDMTDTLCDNFTSREILGLLPTVVLENLYKRVASTLGQDEEEDEGAREDLVDDLNGCFNDEIKETPE